MKTEIKNLRHPSTKLSHKILKNSLLDAFQCRNLFIFICNTMQFDNRHHFIPHHDIRYKNNLLIKSYHQRKQIPMLFCALVQEKAADKFSLL